MHSFCVVLKGTFYLTFSSYRNIPRLCNTFCRGYSSYKLTVHIRSDMNANLMSKSLFKCSSMAFNQSQNPHTLHFHPHQISICKESHSHEGVFVLWAQIWSCEHPKLSPPNARARVQQSIPVKLSFEALEAGSKKAAVDVSLAVLTACLRGALHVSLSVVRASPPTVGSLTICQDNLSEAWKSGLPEYTHEQAQSSKLISENCNLHTRHFSLALVLSTLTRCH